VCHVFSQLFKVWTHYDQDRSGYIESNELEVLMTNTDKLSAKYIIAPVILVTSRFTNKQRGRVSSVFTLRTRWAHLYAFIAFSDKHK